MNTSYYNNKFQIVKQSEIATAFLITTTLNKRLTLSC